MRVLAIIPAYNEEESLPSTMDEFLSTQTGCDYLVVNDGSSDGTERVCRERGYNHVTHPTNLGLTGGVQTGMKYALAHGYDAVIQFDADGQHVPAYIPAMVAEMERTGADVVIGSRFVDERKSLMEQFAKRFDFGPEPDSLAYLMRHGAKVREVQVEMRERTAGESYLNFAKSISYMARTCTSILFVQWFR